MKMISTLLKSKIALPLDDTTIGVLMIYTLAGMWVYSEHSVLFGVAIMANAVATAVVGWVAKSLGKNTWPPIVLGLILGPIGALAGLIATPQNTPMK